MQKSLLTVLSLIACLPCLADFDYRTYQPVSMAELETRHHGDLLVSGSGNPYIVSNHTLKYRLPVIFSKELRKLSTDNQTLIKAWQSSLRVPDDFVQRYRHEFKAVFGKQVYWIPVQADLLLPMESELHPGDRFELYVLVIGSINNKLVLLATEFRSDRVSE